MTPRPTWSIVGAGYTGLWTAYYLAEADPTLRIVVLEAEVAGYGASGRNGGWCSALFPASLGSVAGLDGGTREAALAQHAAMRATVDEVVRVAAAEGIDAHVAKGGTISLVRSPAQLRRARAEISDARAWGRGEDDLRFLDADRGGRRPAGHPHPGRDVHAGLRGDPPRPAGARAWPTAVERRGVRIHERTPVTAIEPGRAVTAHGTVRAEVVVRATEGYTATLAGQRRAVAPVHSLIIATEPLPADVWDGIGLRRRETFSDHRHLIIYGQRTADDRLVFGGRGAPYFLASRTRATFDGDYPVFRRLHRTLVDLFPGGRRPPGHARVGRRARRAARLVRLGRAGPPAPGSAWAGGYVGDGVGTTNLAGRTLRRPGAAPGHRPGPAALGRAPVPGLGAGAAAVARASTPACAAPTAADVEERLTRHPSLIARAMAPLTGH